MTNAQMDLVWQKAAANLEDEFSPVNYAFWIAPLKPIHLDGKKLVLLVRDIVTKNMLELKYMPTLEKAAAQSFGARLSVELVLEDTAASYETQPSMPQRVTSSFLNPKYTFDSYVSGESNKFAVAAAKAVAESPGKSYNPLFIYGGVGLGKTHLMHAIGNYIQSRSKSSSVVYVTSEKFMNELIESIRNDKNMAFRNKYRSVDTLLIDDIQFIAGKDATEEEFFHTFNALYELNKQIVISSDRPPRDIPTLEERLRSRFEWGLTTDIQRPSYEMRIAILRKKAEMENITIPEEILQYIAQRVESNIRELEGALTRVIAYSQLTGKRITIDLATEALRSILPDQQPRITPDRIIDAAAATFGRSRDELFSKKRNQSITLPRQYAMYLCREMTDLSLPKIGEMFGGRDHTTVIHACEKISQLLASDREAQSTLEDIKHRVLND